MKLRWKIGLAVWGIGLLLQSSVSAFELTGQNWSYMPNPMGEDWRICTTGMPAGGAQRTQDGAFAWNYTLFEFTFGGNACLSGGTYPSFNEVNQVDFGGGLGAGVLAQTTSWFLRNAPENTVECDMRFHNAFSWYTGTGTPPAREYDWWSVAAHEMGHCLGLGHEDDVKPRPVMGSTFAAGEVRRALTADDVNGRNAIYGTESTCPLSTALRGTPERQTSLETMSRFRDEVMVQTPEGRQYVRLFYQHALEGSLLVLRYPDLRRQVRDVVAWLQPILEAAVDGQPVTLTATDVAGLEAFLDAFAAKASSRLQRTLRHVRSDLHREKLLNLFGIDVEASH